MHAPGVIESVSFTLLLGFTERVSDAHFLDLHGTALGNAVNGN